MENFRKVAPQIHERNNNRQIYNSLSEATKLAGEALRKVTCCDFSINTVS